MATTTELDTLSEESYKDSTLIMQLLRDNLVSPSITTSARVACANRTSRLSGLPLMPRLLQRRPTRPPRLLPRLQRRRPQSLLLRLRSPRPRSKARALPFFYRDRFGLQWLIPPEESSECGFGELNSNETWFTQHKYTKTEGSFFSSSKDRANGHFGASLKTALI